MFKYITDCRNVPTEEMCEVLDREESVSSEEIQENVSLESIKKEFPEYDWDGTGEGKLGDLDFWEDWCISFGKSFYKGKEVYIINHSGIDYIFG